MISYFLAFLSESGLTREDPLLSMATQLEHSFSLKWSEIQCKISKNSGNGEKILKY